MAANVRISRAASRNILQDTIAPIKSMAVRAGRLLVEIARAANNPAAATDKMRSNKGVRVWMSSDRPRNNAAGRVARARPIAGSANMAAARRPENRAMNNWTG